MAVFRIEKNKNYTVMQNSKTIAQRMEEARIQAGAQNYKGHGYMDLVRFDENTRHMIIFHVLTHDSPVGDKGDRMRLFLSDKGYQKALENEKHGNLPYVFIALFCTKLGQAARLAPGEDFAGKFLYFMEGLSAAFAVPLPSFHPMDLCVGIAIAAAMRLGVYVKGKNAKKFRKNMEYGSARWSA